MAAKAGGPTVKLSSGYEMPMLGLGTWQAAEGEVGAAVKAALEAGYRHIDCAACYGNEEEVGKALSDTFAGASLGIKREDAFITSKLWNSEHRPEHVRPACEMTLKELQLDYLDLYIVHWPQAFEHVEGTNRAFPRNEDGSIKYNTETTLLETWSAMEQLVDAGLVRSVGLSNFNASQLQEILDNCRIKPVCNQVESHPFFQQQDLLKYCTDRGVVVTAYSPLGTGKAFNGEKVVSHPVLSAIGKKHGVYSAAQVAIAFHLARGIPTFPKSVQPDRIKQNYDSVNIKLTEEDLAEIAKLDWEGGRGGWAGPTVERNGRVEPRDLIHPNYPFRDDVPPEGL